MVTIFINDFEKIGEIVNLVLPLEPESMETYDDKTLKLAVKYFYTFAQKLGAKNILSLFFQFLPEFWLLLRGGMPKLVLQIEFNGIRAARVLSGRGSGFAFRAFARGFSGSAEKRPCSFLFLALLSRVTPFLDCANLYPR